MRWQLALAVRVIRVGYLKMLPEIDPKKSNTRNFGFGFGFSRKYPINCQIIVSPIRQQVKKKGWNTKVRSTYRYYCTNQTNKQSINITIKFLIALLGQVSGLDHNLLGFKGVWVIRVPGVETRIKFGFLKFLPEIVIG